MYKVSVLVPIYGVEKYIMRCAVSLFEQTYQNIEYIFVDDCSLDNSIKILKDVINRFPARIEQVRLIKHEQNKGLACARNTAVQLATGTFLTHVDSDDWVENNFIELLVREQIRANADIVSSGATFHYKNEKTAVLPKTTVSVKQMTIDLISGRINPNIWGKLIRTSLYKKNNIKVKEGINLAEDFQVTPILYYYSNNISYVSRCLYNYNLLNESSYVHNFGKKNIEQGLESFKIIKDFFSNKDKEYIEAIYLQDYKRSLLIMKNSSQIKSLYPYYISARNSIFRIPRKYRVSKLPDMVIPYLYFYWLVHIYIKIIRLIRNGKI